MKKGATPSHAQEKRRAGRASQAGASPWFEGCCNEAEVTGRGYLTSAPTMLSQFSAMVAAAALSCSSVGKTALA